MRNPAAFATDDPAPPISSLIDVAFLLLIFFIVTTTILKRETDLGMNVGGDRGAAKIELPVEIHVDEFGAVMIGSGRALELVEPAGSGLIGPSLRERLKFAVDGAAPNELPVVLDISGEASQQRVVAVLDTMAGLGIHRVNMIDR